MNISPLFPACLLAAVVFATAAADDIRSKVKEPDRTIVQSLEIDPDVSVYGVPFGAKEDDLIQAYGKPDGYFRLNDTYAALIYGRSHAFVFGEGKLIGVRITDHLLDWKLANNFQSQSAFDMRKWRLSSGITKDMNRGEARKVLGKRLQTDGFGYGHHYTTDKARVELDFSHYTNEGERDEAYKLHGIFVQHGASGGGAALTPALPDVLNYPKGTNSYGGIGIMAGWDRDLEEIVVQKVLEDTPASAAGIQAGQRIRAVDNMPTKGRSLAECTLLLRGQPGTKLKLEVYDPGKSEGRSVELTRKEFSLPRGGGLPPDDHTTLALTTNQVLRLTTANGESAAIQFLSLNMNDRMETGQGRETAVYRWRHKASSTAGVTSGTSTKVNEYTMKLLRPNEYYLTSDNNWENKRIKLGNIQFTWSYGNLGKAFIYYDSKVLKASVDDSAGFDEWP
jgi:hypothetical protein